MIYILALILTLFFEFGCEKYPITISFGNAVKRGLFNSKEEFLIPVLLRVLLFMPFFLTAALRYNVGTDYETYRTLQIPEALAGKYDRIEPIYIPFIYLFSGILNTDQLFFSFIHFLIMLFVFKAIQNQSKDKYMSIFLLLFTGFFNMSLNIMRQSIAIAIMLYGIKYLETNKYKKFSLSVLVAFLFHKSALAYGVLILLKNIKIRLFVLPLVSALCYLLKDIIKRFVVFLASFTSYSHYFENKWWDVQISSTVMILVNISVLIIFYLILFYTSSYFEKDLWKNPKHLIRKVLCFLNSKLSHTEDYLYLNLQIFTTLLSLCTFIIPNAIRVNYLFFSFQILTIPYFITKLDNKKMKYALSFFIAVCYIVMFYRYFVTRGMGETFPYTSIF